MQLKEVSFFQKFINSIKIARLNKQSEAIISALRKHPKFPVDKSEFVKYSAYFMCEDDPNLCVFFADGDNLRVANQIADLKATEINLQKAKSMNLKDVSLLPHPITGEEIVDRYIESILTQIKDINKQYGYDSALLGVQGDEIFIAIPHIKQEDIQTLYNSYCKVQSGLITISVGYCDDMTHGVENAFGKAEQDVKEIKHKKKEETRKAIFQSDADKVLDEELKVMLSQLRIRIENLTQQQKQLLKTNISTSFKDSLKTAEGIVSDVKSSISKTHDEDSISKRIQQLDAKLPISSTIYPEQRTNYILAQVLSQTPVEGIPKSDYFLQQKARSLPLSKKRTFNKYKNDILVSIEFSGIKDMNETYGYTECDQRIYKDLEKIRDIVLANGIKMDTPIFSRQISSYGFLVSENQVHNIQKLSDDVASMPSDFKISVAYSSLIENINTNIVNSILDDKRKTSKDILEYLLNTSENSNRQKNAKTIFQKKISDTISISRYITRNLKTISQTVGIPLTPQLVDSALNQVLSIETITEPQAQESKKYNIER